MNKWRIYYQIYSISRRKVGEGIYPKKFIFKWTAVLTAKRIYRDKSRFKWYVAKEESN